jgi:phospholipase/lecithinase/hemolysin
MADWESELQDLLRTLDVSLEQNALLTIPAEPPALSAFGGALADESDPSDSMVRAFEQAYEQPTDLATPDGMEINAIRQEIEATVARVVSLTRAGQLDRAVRDDVVLVLRALTRPHPSMRNQQTHDDWHLASAAAILHFCRVVLRLTQPLELDE